MAKKYQPENKALLVNTDWGLPGDLYDRKTAKQLGLVKWQGRWVQREEKKVLNKERNAYVTIRQVAGLCWISAVLNVVLISQVIGESPRLSKPMQIEVCYTFVWVALLIFFGFHLWKFRNFARHGLMVMLLFDLVLAGLAYRRDPSFYWWPLVRLANIVVYGFILYGSVASEIFDFEPEKK